MKTIRECIGNNSYPGRGVIIGLPPMTGSGRILYQRPQREQQEPHFCDGRRGDIFTPAFRRVQSRRPQPDNLQGGSPHERGLIVTNGDQTDTIAGS